jgi:hypothetical protein
LTGSAVEILSPIATGDLHCWRGLPAHLNLAGVTAAFPRDSDWSGAGQLGRRHRAASYLWADLADPQRKMRVWFEEDRVVLIDLACSWIHGDRDRIVGFFGEPAAALDTWQGVVPMPRAELVFPGSGIAVFFSRDLGSIWHLALYSPVALNVYEDDLRLNMETRRHKPREQ